MGQCPACFAFTNDSDKRCKYCDTDLTADFREQPVIKGRKQRIKNIVIWAIVGVILLLLAGVLLYLSH